MKSVGLVTWLVLSHQVVVYPEVSSCIQKAGLVFISKLASVVLILVGFQRQSAFQRFL